MASKPIRVFYSPLSCRFYATRAWKEVNGHIEVTGEKFDVTQDIASAIFNHEIEFTKISDENDRSKHIESICPVV